MLNYKVEKGKNESKKPSSPVNKILSKRIENIFIRFSSAIKTAQIYECNNLTFIEHISSLYSSIEEIFGQEGRALFQFQENTLFFNNSRIKFDLTSYHNFKFLADEFKKKEIGTIGFEPGLDDDELAQFVAHLAHSNGKNGNPFGDFEIELK